MAIKPGDERGNYVWTGTRWRIKPQRTADKVALQREIAAFKRSAAVSAAGRGTAPSVTSTLSRTAMASWPGKRGAPMTRGRTAPAPPKTPERPFNANEGKAQKGSKGITTKPKTEEKKVEKPKSSGKSEGQMFGGGGNAGAKRKSQRAMPTVSQSRTMWVKKGTVVGGKEVKKGYLAQYGRPEKRVSANVQIVAETTSGKKAGETYAYKKGRSGKKVQK